MWYQSARSALLQALMLRGCTPQTCAMEIDTAVVEAHLMRPPHKVRRIVRTYSERTLTPRPWFGCRSVCSMFYGPRARHGCRRQFVNKLHESKVD